MSVAHRIFIAVLASAFVTGTAMAQNAPPPQQPPPGQGAMPAPQATHPPSKCKTKPNGCPKRKNQQKKKNGTGSRSGNDAAARADARLSGKPIEPVYLGESDVARLLSWHELIAAMERVLAEFSRGDVLQPVRTVLTIEEGRQRIHAGDRG